MNKPTNTPPPRMRYRLLDLREARKNPDLQLITDYLMNALDPDQLAVVQRRLEEDPAFRDFAAPILAYWDAVRQPLPPRSRSEIEAGWQRIQRRAEVIKEERTRRRWLWIGATLTTLFVALVVAIIAFAKRPVAGVPAPQPAMADTSSLYRVIADSGHVMTVANGVKVKLDPGATLRVPRSNVAGTLTLAGTATFVTPDGDAGNARAMKIETQSAVIDAVGEVRLTVVARGDTTSVFVSAAPSPSISATPPLVILTAAEKQNRVHGISLKIGEGGRIIRGRNPMQVGR